MGFDHPVWPCYWPDIVVVEKENNKVIIVDTASPWDHREGEKIEKYQDLKREIGRLGRHLEVVPVVVSALRVVSNRLDAWLETLSVTIRKGLLQKIALLGTARILRKLLESWRRRNDIKDLWPLDMARSFGVMSASAGAKALHLHNNNNNNNNNNNRNGKKSLI